MSGAATMLLALALDAVLGWPGRLFARIGHPVSWIGAAISWLEARLNRGTRRARRAGGALTVLCIVGGVALAGAALTAVLPEGAARALLAGVLAWPLLAARSMHDHVVAVAAPLARGDVGAARAAVARIVGRDPALLDAPAIARATLESLAENASDGVVAPVFWGVLLGLPGVAAYKAVNTLDSMIGHRTDRFEAFGMAAARLDDAANLIPARLSGGLLALVSRSPRAAFRRMRQEAGQHRSPNAGWPEAAMAAALGVSLSGPRRYADRVAEEPWLNAAARDPGPEDIARGLALCRRGAVVLATGLALLAMV